MDQAGPAWRNRAAPPLRLGRDGHTFILVGPNGMIRWRADYYGDPPKYIMFLPAATMLADMKAGEHPS